MPPVQSRHPLLRWKTWLWIGIGMLAGGKFVLKALLEPTISPAEKIIALVGASAVGGLVAACLLWRDHREEQHDENETDGPPRKSFLGTDAWMLPIWIAVAVVIAMLFVVYVD